jgi:phosphoribosylformylglycinamidine synthase
MLIPADGNYSATTIAAQGFDPHLSEWSSFHGSQCAVLDSLAKIVAMGGDYKSAYLSLQEYMPRQSSPEKWGQTLAALLGANVILRDFNLAAIGGKDSISGTFKDIDVPPTLIAFALTVGNANHVLTPEFKKTAANVGWISVADEEGKLLSSETIKEKYDYLVKQIEAGNISSAYAVGAGGMIEAVAKMAMGNEIGFRFNNDISADVLNNKYYGSIVVEIKDGVKLDDTIVSMLGQTTVETSIQFGNESVLLADILESYESTLESVFRTKTSGADIDVELPAQSIQQWSAPGIFIPKTRNAEVVIPVFPGTNGEDDMSRAFRDAGANVKEVCIRNLTSEQVAESAERLARAVNGADIIALPGGFSGGDEPDGAAKLIVSLFRNPSVTAAVNEMLAKRDGLMLGVCNGFQALAKLGMFRNGQINEVDETYPTLGTNTIARHVSEYSQVKIRSTYSPWLTKVKTGELYQVPVSHGEGKFLASDAEMTRLLQNGQVFSQYTDHDGKATMLRPYNPNGSMMAIEGIISPDGRVLGKMGHVERVPERGQDIIGKNIPGKKFMPIIPAGVDYVERTRYTAHCQ